jgi:formylglycine-generating enzyme required for sulfatase activity
VNHPGGTDVNGKFLPRTTSVGSYAANPWGLFDMHGNVMEWCEDRFGAYPVDAVTDPLNSDSGWNRVMRGGSWTSPVEFYGSARRHSLSVDARFCGNGFRFVLIPLAEEIGQGEEAPAQDDATPAEEWTASFDGEEAGDRRVIDVDGVSYSFRWAPPGTFTMGSPETEEGRADDEAQQEVALTRGFWILETEVTQLMWKSLMGSSQNFQHFSQNWSPKSIPISFL